MILAIIAIVVVALIALVVVGTRKRSTAQAVATPERSLPASSEPTSWTGAAGEDFAALSEAQRCDFIFAIRDLPGDERSQILTAALDDPSEVVVLAAATALTARGERALVERYFADRPGSRSERIARDLSLLTGSATASS